MQRRQLHRAGELLAIPVQPDHRLPGAAVGRAVPADGRVLGDVPGLPGAAGGRQRLRLAGGLLHGAELLQRRLHRRLTVLRQHRAERNPAAVRRAEQQPRRLDNGVWNQVFSGDVGAPAQNFGSGGQFTTLAASPVTEEEPFLQQDSAGNYSVFVPAVQHNSAGTTWGNGPTPGTAVPIQRFFIASPGTPVGLINAALVLGKDLILTPGVYNLNHPIVVARPDTVVLGLGFPTLVPAHGNVSMLVASVPGVKLSGMIFDAGPANSPALLQVGLPGRGWSDLADPTLVQDVFFRVGGATPGQASNSLVVNSSQVILDDIWAWRADHGNGVGWTDNVGNTGVVVNGDDVTAYGLFVEHYEQANVIWNGRDGTDIFFQNEMPYDPPSQAAWMEKPVHRRLPGVPDHTARG